MYILGDIGNSETKVFLVSTNGKILKRINFLSKNINHKILNLKFKHIDKDFNKIKKILFCSVVPNTFDLLKNIYQKKQKLDALK